MVQHDGAASFVTWVKLDDLLPGHSKIRRAGPSAAWLYIAGLCYCSRYLTDGFVPDVELAGLGNYGLLRARHLAGVLIQIGLWEQVNGGYCVHDYLDYQPSKEKVEGQREAKRRAGQAGGQAHAKAPAKAKE